MTAGPVVGSGGLRACLGWWKKTRQSRVAAYSYKWIGCVNDIFRARAGLRLEQNQADGEGRAVGVGRREKIVALCACADGDLPVELCAGRAGAGTPGLQRAGAAPERVARMLGPR